MNIQEYLQKFDKKISFDEYLKHEKNRINKNKIDPGSWIRLIESQKFKCYYCNTDLETIQEIIYYRLIDPRKRGEYGFSGMHFELDHKNANKNDNSTENLVAACYYCNNDKSNTFSSKIFKDYFGKQKYVGFESLFNDKKLTKTNQLRHHFQL
jgi:5-methylcytosine-specific restriction endonuclease McrA